MRKLSQFTKGFENLSTINRVNITFNYLIKVKLKSLFIQLLESKINKKYICMYFQKKIAALEGFCSTRGDECLNVWPPSSFHPGNGYLLFSPETHTMYKAPPEAGELTGPYRLHWGGGDSSERGGSGQRAKKIKVQLLLKWL